MTLVLCDAPSNERQREWPSIVRQRNSESALRHGRTFAEKGNPLIMVHRSAEVHTLVVELHASFAASKARDSL